MAAISASTLSWVAGLASGEAGGELGELAASLGQGLVEASGLLVVQVLGMAHDDAPVGAEHDLGGLEGGQPGERLGVDGPVAALGDGEKVGVVRRRERADEMQWRVLEQLEVVF